MATAREPILSLTTLTSSPLITIDGVAYELLHPQAVSLGQLRRIKQLGVDITALENKAEPTPEEDARLSQLMAALCGLVLKAPAEVLAGLTDLQRQQVVVSFIQLRSTLRAPAAGAVGANRSSGKKPSRGSRGSTAGRRTTGSGRSRSRS